MAERGVGKREGAGEIYVCGGSGEQRRRQGCGPKSVGDGRAAALPHCLAVSRLQMCFFLHLHNIFCTVPSGLSSICCAAKAAVRGTREGRAPISAQ
jgi:hypothetical protein